MRSTVRRSAVLLTAIATLLAVPALPAVAQEADTAGPVVTGVSASPTTVDVSTTAGGGGCAESTITVTYTDETGLESGTARVMPPVGSSGFPQDVPLAMTTQGTATGTALFCSNDAVGDYSVNEVVLTDSRVNRSTTANSGDTITVVDSTDRTGPSLTGLTLSTQAVNTTDSAATVPVTVSAADPSGVIFLQLVATAPDGTTTSSVPLGDVDRTSGTPASGTYGGDLVFPVQSPPGRWTLSLTVVDANGNETAKTSSQLAATGFPSTVQVTTTVDSSGPVLTAASVSPTRVNKAYDGIVTLALSATDDVSGVVDGFALLTHSTSTASVVRVDFSGADRISGTSRNGSYRAQFAAIPRSFPAGRYELTSVTLFDGSGKRTEVLRAALPAGGVTSVTVVDEVDTTAPALVSVTGPASVDSTTGDKVVTFAVRATDASSGTTSVDLELVSPSGGQRLSASASTPVVGSSLDGTFNLAVTIGRFVERGTWRVESVRLGDQALNAATSTGTDLSTRTTPAGLAVTSDQDLNGPVVTGVSVDLGAPATDGTRRLTVTILATDDKSGLTTGSLAVRSAAGSSANNDRDGQFAFAFLPRPSGATPLLGATYAGQITLPAGADPGAWRIDEISLRDEAGNTGRSTTAVLDGAGIVTQVPVPGTADDAAPVLTGLVATTTAVDTTAADRTIAFEVSATDVGTGLAFGSVELASPDGRRVAFGFFGPSNRVSGTDTYRASVTVRRFATPGVWRVSVSLNDQVGNRRKVTGSDLPAAARTVSVTSTEDTIAPTLAALTLSPNPVDTRAAGQTVTASVTSSDTQSGVAFVRVELTSPSGQRTYVAADDVFSSPSSILLFIPQWTEDGMWGVTAVELRDRSGNVRRLDKAALDAAGLTRTVTVDAGNDGAAPTLTGLTLTPSTVDTSSGEAVLRVAATATDTGGSGVGFAEVVVEDPAASSRTYRTSLGDGLTGEIRLPKGVLGGTWKVRSVLVSDLAENEKSYTHADLGTLGVTRTFTVVGSADTVGPVLAGLTARQTAVDVSGVGKEVDLLLSVTDDRAGFEFGSVVLRSPSGQESVRAFFGERQRRTGTDLNGSYLVSVYLPLHSERGTWTVSSVELVDALFTSTRPTSSATVTVTSTVVAPPALDFVSVLKARTRMNVEWSLRRNGGSPVTGFEVQAVRTSDDARVGAVVTVGATARTAVLTGLVDGTSHYAVVRAVSAAGRGAPAASEPAVPGPGAPLRPGSISATPVSAGSTTVAWQAPADDGGSPVTGYEVEVYDDTTGRRIATRLLGATARSTAFTGLVDGRNYFVGVAAVNALGTGSAAFTSTSAPANAAPAITTVALGASSLSNPVLVTFSEDVRGVSPTTLALRSLPSTTVTQAAQVCRNAANAVVSCATGPVRRAELRPASLVHPAGQKYVVAISAGVLDTAGKAAVARSSSAVRASTVEQEGSLSGAGTWSTTATTTTQASGGSYIRSNQAGTLAEYVFTGSSVTWTTVKGPLFGKVDLFVDGVRKVTGLNLYAATTTYKVNRTITGLTNAKHTLRVVALGQRGSTAVPITSSFVASDAVKGSGSTAVLQLPTRAWRTVPLTAALAGSYSSSSAVGTTYTFRFRGTAVAWKTLTSSAMGTASVTIDGVARPTVSNASSTATRARKSVSYAGLSDALHTLVIKVASKTVAVDGFTVS